MSDSNQYPSTKEILRWLGMGLLITTAIFSPGAGLIVKNIYKGQRKKEYQALAKELGKYNIHRLRRNLKRLQQQTVVEISEDGETLTLTKSGQNKFLRLNQEAIANKSQKWNGKWYLVIYDISHLRKSAQQAFRKSLKELKCFPLQKSVYLTPFDFRLEIEYFREKYQLGGDVIIIEVSSLENEPIYKQYFGLE